MEAAIFVTFVILQAAAKSLPHLCERIQHFVLVQRVSANHWVVWLVHPAVLHGLHDYVVHFVVYSGYVLHAH